MFEMISIPKFCFFIFLCMLRKVKIWFQVCYSIDFKKNSTRSRSHKITLRLCNYFCNHFGNFCSGVVADLKVNAKNSSYCKDAINFE